MAGSSARPHDSHAAALAAVRALFAESKDGVLEQIAAEHGLSPRDVAGCLPDGTGVRVPGALFEEVMHDVSDWGAVTFLVHTPDLILECTGEVPRGVIARGYFNLIGDSPVGGHLRHQNCTDIQFVSRPLMGHASHGIIFFNADGGIMFKIFVGRDKKFALKPDQVARFQALRDRLAARTVPPDEA